jgi:mannose-6-phosphate isomerase-like protein (cupin superfamily)
LLFFNKNLGENSLEVVYQREAVASKGSPFISVFEYCMKDKEINGAKVILKGRYPERGWVENLTCKEMAYVMDGSGKLVVEGKKFLLSKGDLVLILPKEKYYWEGKMTLFVPTTPAWTKEQHRHMEEENC